MKSLKPMMLGALSAALLCGCGGSVDKKPMVAEGSVAALAIQIPQSGPLKEVYDLATDGIVEGAGAKGEEFFKEAGLDPKNLNCKWISLSCSKVELDDRGDLKRVPDIALAAALPCDMDKIIAAIEKLSKGEAKFDKGEYKGQAFYKVAGDDYDVRAMREMDAVICFASLKGKLLLVASNENFMKTQIDLYLKGKGKSDDFKDFTFKGGDVMKFNVVDVGEMAAGNPLVAMVAMGLENVLPDAGEIIKGLDKVALAISSDDKSMSIELVAETSKAEHAKAIADLIAGSKQAGIAQFKKLAKYNNEYKVPLEILQSLDVETEEGKLTVSSSFSLDPVVKSVKQVKESAVRYRESSQANACVSNMKQIQCAYEQAMMCGDEVNGVADLCGPEKYIKVEPKCPCGGSYKLEKKGDSCEVICTSGKKDHSLPSYSY